MNNSKFIIKFKNHFKNITFYSMPVSILFIFRKRLNFILNFIFILIVLLFSIL